MVVMFVQRFQAVTPYFWKMEPARGGVYSEGVIGNVDKINPLFILNNSESAANRLVFSGLTRKMPDKIIPDLAKDWTIEENGRVYIFNLKDNLKWHDGEKLTADDIVFTINLIQNPDTRTPEFVIWKGVTVEKTGDLQVKFTLPTDYPDFLNVAQTAILPKHLLNEIAEKGAKNIKIADFNKNPIGSGPYKFVRFDQGAETELVFEANENFALGRPYLEQVRLRTYDTFSNLYKGFMRKQIDGISDIPMDKVSEVDKISNLNNYQFYLPRYQLLIFNLRNEFLKTIEMRQAIEAGINRKAIISDVLKGQAEPAYAPVIPGEIGYDPKFRIDKYDQNKANDILEKAGWTRGQNGIRQKDGKELTFKLVSPEDEESTAVVNEIKKELSAIGINLQVEFSHQELLQANYLRPRNFDLILVGQEAGESSDLYSFWHSSQAADPGLNLSGINSKKLDKFLEIARKSSDPKDKADKLILAQEEILAQTPGIFLYNPVYSIALTKNIKGFQMGNIASPVDHLNSIYKWFSKEKIKY
jgi:peptide/nickel transport system substrate-binding protein